MRKRILSLLISLCMVIALFPAVASAAIISYGECGDELTYTLDSNGTLTISGTGRMEDFETTYFEGKYTMLTRWGHQMNEITKVVIEEGVTYIGENAFIDADNLTKVVIADSVTEIGEFAFKASDKIKSFTFGPNLTKINDYAFQECSSLTSISFKAPNVEFGDGVFWGCVSLRNITLPSDITEIAVEMFYGCDGITTFDIPDTVTIISSSAFRECKNLKYITIPDTVIAIVGGAFRGCINLRSITIPDSVTYIGAKAFYSCTSLTSITVPGSVKVIGDNAFDGCSKLSSITLSEGIEELGSDLFAYCSSLKEITIPSTVTRMRHTFENSYQLKTIKFTGHAPVVYSELFGNITTTVYYPENVASWQNYDLENYGGTVTWVGYTSDIELPAILDSGTCGYNLRWTLTDSFTLIISGNGAMFDYSYDEPWKDWHSVIHDGIVEEGVTHIGKHAFESCRNLKTVIIPGTVKSIGNSAFLHTQELIEITFNGSAPAVSGAIFENYTATAYYPSDDETWTQEAMDSFGGNLTWEPLAHAHRYEAVVTAPTCTEKGYTTYTCSCGKSYIDNYVNVVDHSYSNDICTVCGQLFDPGDVPVVASGTCCETLTWVLDADGTLTISGNGALEFSKPSYAQWYNYRDSVISVVIEDGVTYIGSCGFWTCTNLKSADISGSVKNIGSGAFSECDSLETVNISYGVESIDASAFCYSDNLRSVNIPESVTRIGEDAFYRCEKLENVNIPSSVTVIEKGAFNYCESLKSITIPEGVTKIANSTFCGCISLESIDIHNNITIIGPYAFDGCTSLTNVIIPDSVTSIGLYAFRHCDNLKSITVPFVGGSKYKNRHLGYIFGASKYSDTWMCFPDSLEEVIISDGCTSIADYGFYDCSSLKRIIIPESVTSIGYSAFRKCTNLESIVLPSNLKSLSVSMFSGCNNLKSVNIPDGITSIPGMFGGCRSLSMIILPDSVTELGESAFSSCESLECIVLPVSVTKIHATTFSNSAVTSVFYFGTEENKKSTIAEQNDTLEMADWHYEVERAVFCGTDCIYCPECDKYFSYDGTALSHKYEQKVTEVTCTEKGYITYTCVCGDSYVDDYIDATGHFYENDICTVCGQKFAPGDATGDGKVNALDLVRLKKFLSGADVTFDASGADATGDGNVDARDLVRLKKYLSGADVTLG